MIINQSTSISHRAKVRERREKRKNHPSPHPPTGYEYEGSPLLLHSSQEPLRFQSAHIILFHFYLFLLLLLFITPAVLLLLGISPSSDQPSFTINNLTCDHRKAKSSLYPPANTTRPPWPLLFLPSTDGSSGLGIFGDLVIASFSWTLLSGRVRIGKVRCFPTQEVYYCSESGEDRKMPTLLCALACQWRLLSFCHE